MKITNKQLLMLLFISMQFFNIASMSEVILSKETKQLWNTKEYPTLQQLVSQCDDIKDDVTNLKPKYFPMCLMNDTQHYKCDSERFGVSTKTINYLKDQLSPVVPYDIFYSLLIQTTDFLKKNLIVQHYPVVNKKVNAYTRAIKVKNQNVFCKIGDIHASWQDAVKFTYINEECAFNTDDFKLKSKYSNYHFIFNGDYTDILDLVEDTFYTQI